MKNIYIIKLSSDIDKQEIIPLSCSKYQKVWSSQEIDNEEEDNIDTYNPEISDSDMLEILSSLVCSLCQKRQLYINTDFTVTVWMSCVTPHIHKEEKYNSYSDHKKQVNNVINYI